jgi:hypothetical protein
MGEVLLTIITKVTTIRMTINTSDMGNNNKNCVLTTMIVRTEQSNSNLVVLNITV